MKLTCGTEGRRFATGNISQRNGRKIIVDYVAGRVRSVQRQLRRLLRFKQSNAASGAPPSSHNVPRQARADAQPHGIHKVFACGFVKQGERAAGTGERFDVGGDASGPARFAAG